MSTCILDIRNLNVRLPMGGDRVHAVNGLSLSVKKGEVVCIVGESGSGKSVTASAVMGLLPPAVMSIESGTIHLDGVDITHASLKQLAALRGNRMAMIFQEPMTALNPLMPVGAQIAEVFQFHAPRLGRKEIQGRVLSLLDDVRLPDPQSLAHAYPHQLSGGQRQRVMIAMALAMEPSLIIADEPTTALDVTSQAQVLHLLNELKVKRNIGILFITHDFGVVAEIADVVIVMQRGVIVESGPARRVLDRPQHAYTRQLLDAVPTGAQRAGDEVCAPVVMSVENLSKVFSSSSGFGFRRREVAALDNVSLALRRGETLGIVGESGSGKTTLGRCLARFIEPSSGHIQVGGVTGAGQSRQWCKHVQMVFQDPYRSFNPKVTMGVSLAEGPLNYGEPKAVVHQRMLEMLRLVNIDASALDRYPHEFSGGQRQRMSIARALMMQPQVLIADESVSALDVSVQAQILELLESIREQLALSIVFITHDLRVAARLCHRIAVMQRGRLVELEDTKTLFESPGTAYTRQLIDAIPGGLISRERPGDLALVEARP